ncbi:MAG: hypothetical protein US88_C0002G0034 [Parcubacteria group bacterium GW2011_GWA2_38_27]|nr:MAG: hypothetical protein US88_C0002G0034 [Parcubacteria group bacterium GW2011_GWA2_38_27]
MDTTSKYIQDPNNPNASIPNPNYGKKLSFIDFLKEIPATTQKVINVIQGLSNPSVGMVQLASNKKVQEAGLSMGKEVLRGTARSGGSVAMTLATPFIGTQELTSEQFENDPDLKWAKETIFGKDPVKSLQTRIAEAEVKTKPYLGKTALPLSVVGVGLMTGLDFTGAGGEKNAIKLLSKTSKIEEVGNILKSLKVADELIPEYSKVFAGITKEAEVANKLNEVQKATKVVGLEKELRQTYLSSKPAIEENLGKVWQELDMSEAGERILTGEAGQTAGGEWIGKPSSFPDWIPENLRSKELFDKVMNGLSDVEGIKFPVGNRPKQRELYNILLDEVEKKSGLDSSKIRNQIIEIYGEINKGEITESVRGGVRGSLAGAISKEQLPRGIEELGEIKPALQGGDLATKEAGFLIGKERQFLQSVKEARPDIPIKIGGQYIPRSTDNLAIQARNLIKDNLAEAESIARVGTDDKAVAIASELIKHYGDEAIKTSDQAVKNTLYEKASEVAHTTAEKLTELGRGVQAASIMGRLTPEGMLRFAAKEINKYNDAVDTSKGLFGLKKKIPQLTPEQTETILKEMKNISAMPDGTKKAIAFKKVADAVADIIPSSNFKKFISLWKAGLLTGIKTSGLNTLSNLFHGTSEVIKDIPASAVDSVAGLFTKERTLAFTTKGTLEGIKEGFIKGWQYLTTGLDERNIGAKLDLKKVSFGKGKVAKALQKYEESIFHLMGAEDQPFYYGAKARSLASQAIAQAKNEGLKGAEATKFIEDLIKNPTDKMMKYAVSDAEIAVFQNKTTLGEIAQAVQKAPGGEIVVPFGRTPASVATQMINYSPIGIVKTIVENIGKGKFDQRAFSQGIGRAITGTGAMYIGTELFKKGLISLSYPTSEKEQKLWELEGRTANSINIGGKWRNISIFGPAGNLLIAGGNYQQALEESGSPTQAIIASSLGGIKSLKEQTFLSGINQIINAIDNPQTSAVGYAGGLISSLIPTILGDVAKTTDTTERRTPAILDKSLAKIPGARETLEPQVNVLGQERQLGGNWLETMIDPSRPSNIISTPVSTELRRLWNAGLKSSPTLVGDKNGYKGLTPEENTAIWKRTGELMDGKLNNLINLEQYKKLDDEDRANLVEIVIDKSKLLARAQAVMDLTEELSGQELKNKLSELKKSGLMTKEVFKKYLEIK